MNIRDEIEQSSELIKRRGTKPSKAYCHLLYVMWKGDEIEIDKAIAIIKRAEFFAELGNRGLTEYAEKMPVYWQNIEARGEVPADYLELQ